MTKQTPEPPGRGRLTLLSSKRLSEIAKADAETPSLWKFLFFEALEWLLIAGILFVLWQLGSSLF